LIKAIKYDKCSDESFHLALSSALQSEMPVLKKQTNIFSTIITISPLLGLLGTVLGLIDSFSLINIGQAGVNNIEVTGGISEALISTAAGLIVAIISLVFSNYFRIEFQRELPLIQEFLVKFEISRTESKN
jgi:biopolymer transport protein ExbB